MTAAEKGKIILSGICKVIHTRWPDLFERFNQLPDPRKHKECQMAEIMTGALFMHLFKETSRTTLDYEYLNQIEYDGRYFSWVDCQETVVDTKGNVLYQKRFTFITNIPQSLENVVQTADSGRMKWKIENEGFNAG